MTEPCEVCPFKGCEGCEYQGGTAEPQGNWASHGRLLASSETAPAGALTPVAPGPDHYVTPALDRRNRG
jgi:hypothetical protein